MKNSSVTAFTNTYRKACPNTSDNKTQIERTGEVWPLYDLGQ